MSRRFVDVVPRKKRVAQSLYGRGERRIVAKQDAGQIIRLHPVDSHGGIHLRAEIGRKEPIALAPPRGHQRKDAKRRVADRKAFGRLFGEQPDQGVDPLNIVLVQIPERFCPFGVNSSKVWTGRIRSMRLKLL